MIDRFEMVIIARESVGVFIQEPMVVSHRLPNVIVLFLGIGRVGS